MSPGIAHASGPGMEPGGGRGVAPVGGAAEVAGDSMEDMVLDFGPLRSNLSVRHPHINARTRCELRC